MADQEGIEGIKARLNNVRSVEPILGAMRTISLGSWQSALKRKTRVLAFTDRLLALLPALLPYLTNSRGARRQGSTTPAAPVVAANRGADRNGVPDALRRRSCGIYRYRWKS